MLLNENRLLYRYQGAIGVKTGYVRKAGNCVVGAAQRGDLELIAVSMNSPTVYEDLAQMLDYGFANYQKVTLKTSDQISMQVKVLMGQSTTVTGITATDLVVAAMPEEEPKLTYKIFPSSEVFAPVEKGDTLGICSIYSNGSENQPGEPCCQL